MLHWVGATIVRFQRQEAEVLRDGCILDLLDKGEPQRGLSPRSSFILMVLWTRLWTNALGVDVRRLVASPEGARSDSRGNQGDNCLKHSHYGLDLVGEPLESLGSHHRGLGFSRGGVSSESLNKRQYRPGVADCELSQPVLPPRRVCLGPRHPVWEGAHYYPYQNLSFLWPLVALAVCLFPVYPYQCKILVLYSSAGALHFLVTLLLCKICNLSVICLWKF
ncbi:hypothetical protein BHM03_00025581 [Ensete ventricosum]|nr:hypothetical protein BHM03_00025581 [Ensete ventricosum]